MEQEALWVIRDRVKFVGVMQAPECALLEITVPPGGGTPPHRHESPEIFYLQSGEVTFGNFDAVKPSFTKLSSGQSLTVNSNQAHNYQNNSATTAVMLVVVNHQMVKFFRDIGKRETPPAGPPSDAEIGEVVACCRKHGIEILA